MSSRRTSSTSRLIGILPRRSRPRSAGFTLIELVAIIVILAILAGAAVPAFNSIGNTRSASAARHLLADLTFARQSALGTGTTCWITFDDNAWSVLREDPEAPGFAGAQPIEDRATGRPYTVQLGAGDHHGVSIIGIDFDGGTRVGFDWLGRPLVDNDELLEEQGEVVLTGNHRITVEPETGFAAHTP